MAVSEKIKTINNKIEQNKTLYDLDRQTAKISALSSENVSRYQLLTGKDLLPKKDLIEKAATMKRFEYPSLGRELTAQTDISNKQYQALDKIHELDETINEKPSLKNYSKSYLIYDSNYKFYKCYHDIKKFDNFSLKSKHLFQVNFSGDLDKFSKLKTQKEKTEKKNKCV